MRSMPLVSVLATAMAVAACQSGGSAEVTDAQRTEITAQVTQVIDSLFASMNAGDVDAVDGHYRKSDEFISVTVAQFLEGWNAFSSVTSSFFAQHPGVTFEHRIVQTQVLAPNVLHGSQRTRQAGTRPLLADSETIFGVSRPYVV